MRYLGSILLVLSFVVLLPLGCRADVASDQAAVEAKEISSNVMSPYCPGRLLIDCPSSQATELRHKIEQRLAEGEAKNKVIEWVYAVYGDGLRAAQKKTGFVLVACVTPFLFLFLGLVGVYAWLKKKSLPAIPEAGPALDPEIQARVDSELDDL